MGWFSDVCSSVGNFVSATINTVKDVVSATYETVRNVAGKAMGWMAEKAEVFVGDVKKAWKAVKPYVEKVRGYLLVAAAAVPHPWLRSALIMLEKGIGALTAFENSPIAKKIDAAIKWSIKRAKKWQREEQKREEKNQKNEAETQKGDLLTAEELQIAKEHQKEFRFAEDEIIPEDQRHNLELAAAINDFEIAQTELSLAINAEPTDFEHYLRLRATQKLLTIADKKLRTSMTVDDLSSDDLFLIRIASDLIKANPELNKSAAERLDRVLTRLHGKKLAPFVFEELIVSWAKNAEVLEEQWSIASRAYAKDKMLFQRLTLASNIQDELSNEETSELLKLEISVPKNKLSLDKLAEEQFDIERYVGAAEGFLQLLEKTEEQIEQEDRSYLLEDGHKIGILLINCAEHNKPFSELSADEQSLLNDYANIFKQESKMRMDTILEVAV